MQRTGEGRVVEVTLTRELAPRQYVTEIVGPNRVPTGLFFAPSAVATHLANEQRLLKRCLYRKPTKGR